MPAQQRIRRENSPYSNEQLPAQHLGLHRQAPPLVIVQEKSPVAELLPENRILGVEVFDGPLLLALTQPARIAKPSCQG